MGADYAGYSGGFQCTHRVLKWKKRPKMSGDQREKGHFLLVDFKMEKGWLWAMECGQPLEGGSSKERDACLEPPDRDKALQITR